ncbi:alanyl-tRNA synthetase [Spiroplasma helicoides]|uniref:Alanine--tRNA ligase n=1 Tax=Spiroplasma helicoides TaxID=216938 RepID=A0A1B3SM46_9MOLU|nr:alanine--tRNA ligase [Spiroplasma helicoides]AOG61009.1 alanyl-tRNA synthetase [Spiroplasma helicoides]
MKKLSSNQIRSMWLDYFKSKNHYFLEPVSLVPVDDPSLLWINSGVATLKPYFDGRLNPPSPRLTNSQKSIRTNDIENVGVTARHQTMFEMLGNFSIGDYFKKEAIHFAWELLTSKDWYDMDKDLLYITVFEEDNEAYDIWTKELGIATDHIFKGSRDTNFWDVGQGPCGPNTEIFFDRGEKWDPQKIGSRLLAEDIENDRYIEVWNIVFSQFNNDGQNNYTELPRKNIDTGAGLERLVSIFQDTPTNFETDLFLPTIKEVEKICDKKFKYSIENYFNENKEQTKINTAFKVIADHVRAVTFAISDGVYPGNKDRGYIIRRLIRRSSVYGKKLGINEAFVYKLVDSVILAMSEFYPYIKEKAKTAKEVIENEEKRFLQTLSKGYEHLENIIAKEKKVTGKNALLLFESFGFPIELTCEIANEINVEVDVNEYERLLEEAKELARSARKDDKVWNKQSKILTDLNVESEFVGYELEEIKAKVNFMFVDEIEIKEAKDEIVFITLDKTPFYAEKGGQAADHGILIDNQGNHHNVIDTQPGPNKQNIHKVKLNGSLKVGDEVLAKIDSEKRYYTRKNHSGSHLLQSSIREILGEDALQCGSYNDEKGFRLDITFNRPPTEEEIDQIHKVAERAIKESIPCEIIFCSYDEAINVHKALALFTDKYGEQVRAIKFGNFSCELCGGTHVSNSKELEDIFVTNVESKGSGVYRFIAVTSHKEVSASINEQFVKQKAELKPTVEKFEQYKTIVENKEIENLISEINSLEMNKKNAAVIKRKVAEVKGMFKVYQKTVDDILIGKKIAAYDNLKPVEIDGACELLVQANDLDMKEMKALSDKLHNQYKNLVLKMVNTELKIYMISIGDKVDEKKYSAIDIFRNTKDYNLQGGGNTKFAQGKIV